MDNTTLFGILLYSGLYEDFFQLLNNPQEKTLVFTPNPEIFVRASRDEEFKSLLQKATYNVPDGVGLYLGYELARGENLWMAWYRFIFRRSELIGEYGELIKGSDLTRDILSRSSKQKRKILIIDKKITNPKNDLEKHKMGVQKVMKEHLETLYPNIEAFVILQGDMSPDAIAHFIEFNHIQYVFSCLGMKTQEQVLFDIWSYLPTYTKVVGLGVGASIDFLLGIQKRAPKIFQKLGLEWLYRLMLAPKTRAKRIYDAVVEFPRLVVRNLHSQKK